MISGKPAQNTLLWCGMKWVSGLRKKCPYSELLWSVLSRIRTEYGEIQIISPYSIRMREIKTDCDCPCNICQIFVDGVGFIN